MIIVREIIWDDWNSAHIALHGVTKKEVDEVCRGLYKVVESYRKRLLLVGRTKRNRLLAIVLSPENRNSQPYEKGTYYLITAFGREAKK